MKSIENLLEEKGSVLVLDDEKNIVTVLKAILEKREFNVTGFTEPRLALDALRKEKFNAVITDLYMPEIDGMAFLSEVNRLYPGLPVIMITAFGTVDSAVDAIKKGAFDYVTKPFEQSEIVSVVQKAINTNLLQRLAGPAAQESEQSESPIFWGKNPLMQELQKVFQKIVVSPSTVLLSGEAGTEKELLAEEIHRKSDRAFQALIKMYPSAASLLTIEQELFGGANKVGRLELADKGTLFIEEISELPMELQQKLLAFLEDGKYENPITGERKQVDVRLIASNSKNLTKEMKDGRFREDLFYKLNIVPLVIPPLRERKEDMQEIVRHCMKKWNKRLHKNYQEIDSQCMDVFLSASWPGNLRQLEQVLERMMLLGNGQTLQMKNLPEDLRSEIEANTNYDSSRFREIIKKQTQNLEKELIEKALIEMDGNITKTAEYLGISRKGLQLKIKELGIK